MSEIPFLLKVDRVKMVCSNCGSIPTSEDMLKKAAPKILELALKLEVMSEVLQDLTLTFSHLKRTKTNVDLQRCSNKNVTVTIIGGSIVMNGGQEKKNDICWGSCQHLKKLPVHKGCNVENMKPRVAANRARAAQRIVPVPIIQHGFVKVQPKAGEKQGDADDAAVNKEE